MRCGCVALSVLRSAQAGRNDRPCRKTQVYAAVRAAGMRDLLTGLARKADSHDAGALTKWGWAEASHSAALRYAFLMAASSASGGTPSAL